MTHWFYAVMTEDGITWSRAIRAANELGARSKLAALYPRASVFHIER